MLVARATAEASRWVAADAMMGLPVLAEEIEDGEPAAIANTATTAEGAAADADGDGSPAGAKRTTKRKTTTARAALPAGPPLPPAEPPPPTGERAKVSKPQQTRIHAGLRSIGLSRRDDETKAKALGMIGEMIGHPISSTSDLYHDEAVIVIERIEALGRIAAQDADQPPPPPDDDDTPPPPDDEPA